MYVLLTLIPRVIEMEKLMLSLKHGFIQWLYFQRTFLTCSCPVLLNPQLQKMQLLWEQVSSAQAKLLPDVFTSLQ